MEKKDNLLEEIKALRKKYEAEMEKLENTTLREKRKIKGSLKTIFKTINRLELLYLLAFQELEEDLNGLEKREFKKIQDLIIVGIKKYSDRFLNHGEKLCSLMIKNNIRDRRLNELQEAMRNLGFNIGELERAANDSLKKEGKIKKVKSATESCILITEMILKPEFKLLFSN